MALRNASLRSAVSFWTPSASGQLLARVGFLFERLFDGTGVFVGITVLRSTLFSVRRACFQFIEIERACIGVQPPPQSVALNRALEGQLASERFDQRSI